MIFDLEDNYDPTNLAGPVGLYFEMYSAYASTSPKAGT